MPSLHVRFGLKALHSDPIDRQRDQAAALNEGPHGGLALELASGPGHMHTTHRNTVRRNEVGTAEFSNRKISHVQATVFPRQEPPALQPKTLSQSRRKAINKKRRLMATAAMAAPSRSFAEPSALGRCYVPLYLVPLYLAAQSLFQYAAVGRAPRRR